MELVLESEPAMMQIFPKEHGFDEPLGLLSDCHRRVERFLTILHKVVEQAPEEQLQPLYREGLESALDYFSTAAPKHTADEEESLFPRLCGDPKAEAIMADLEADHKRSEPLHETVERLGRRWLAQGSLAATEREEMGRAVSLLRQLYSAHIKVEDERLFPLAAELLSDSSLQQVGREMAARRGVHSTN